MKRHFRLVCLVVVTLTCSFCSWAQGSITNSRNGITATFVRTASSFDLSPDANFTGVSSLLTQDHVFESGWAIRVDGATSETFFPMPATQNYGSGVSTIAWPGLAGGVLDATEISQVFQTAPDTASPRGYVKMSLTLTNVSPNPVTVNLYHMLDMDLNGSTNDQASLALGAPYRITVTDPVAQGEYAADFADAYLVRPFGATDLGSVLANASVDNFDNTGLPFGPGDFSAGFQWRDRVMEPGAEMTFSVYFSVNEVLESERALNLVSDRVFGNGFEDLTFYTLVRQGGAANALARFSADRPTAIEAPIDFGTGIASCLTQRAIGGYLGVSAHHGTAADYLVNLSLASNSAASFTNTFGFDEDYARVACAVNPRNDRMHVAVSGSVVGSDTRNMIVGNNTRVVDSPIDLGGAIELVALAYTNADKPGVAGTLFGLDAALDQLVTVDVAAGTATVVGPLGFNLSNNGAGLVTVSDTSGYVLADSTLFSIDLTTGALTTIGAITFPTATQTSGLVVAP